VSVPARSEEVAAGADAPADLDRQRSRKAASHYYSTRWRDEIPARFHEKVPPRALELASELGRRAHNETGHCFRTLSSLAEATGRSPRTMRRAIGDLERNSLVRRKQTGRERIDFWILPLPEKRHWIREGEGGTPDASDARADAGEQLALPPNPDTVADQNGQPGRSERPIWPIRTDTVADQNGQPDRPISNCPPNCSRTTPSTRTSVRTAAGDDEQGEAGAAVAAMEARGLNRVEELLECAEPERIIAACTWWDEQHGVRAGLLAQAIRDGGRAPAKALIGVEGDCTLTADLDEAWKSARAALRQSVDEATFSIWLAPLHPHEHAHAGWVLGCPARQVAWTADRFRRVLEGAAGEPVQLVGCARSGDQGTDGEPLQAGA